jgi:hypothetical protein
VNRKNQPKSVSIRLGERVRHSNLEVTAKALLQLQVQAVKLKPASLR